MISIDELLKDCKEHVSKCDELIKTIEESAEKLYSIIFYAKDVEMDSTK